MSEATVASPGKPWPVLMVVLPMDTMMDPESPLAGSFTTPGAHCGVSVTLQVRLPFLSTRTRSMPMRRPPLRRTTV